MNDKIIGIIGGMGPEATADFYMKLIRATKVARDQDHFRIIIDSNAKIPDRTAAILGRGDDPLPAMIQTAGNLAQMGVDIACIPCMTSHYFIHEIQQHVSYPILNVFRELHAYIASAYPAATKIGVLATTGTISMGLFERYMDNLQIICPNADSQNDQVMHAIYGPHGIKSGNLGAEPLSLLRSAAEQLIADGAELVISGCTEIALVLRPEHLSLPLIDPMQIAANTLVSMFS